ncbi:MAG: D-aminoacyl-tRNA deacylase [Bacteroidetes bacterium]|nr:D-aminoacyl-tRNA deacylase [Bacteroidota bacterium]MDA0885014.1 D-aminoacyl-tRNA deacylase [Bacteroidota bacterium]MDA1225451.1 D-aminoacyl-tRNA deacylase [Bacteroidota bacterium]
MKVVIQRVSKSSVEISNKIKSEIQKGLLVFIGIGLDDNKQDVEWIVNKVLNLRVFNDSEGVMNKSLLDINGELILISQFTLLALTKKGNRPSYIKSANHQTAIPLYEYFIKTCKDQIDDKVKTGSFGADMKVSLINDGPVTIIIDSKNKE